MKRVQKRPLPAQIEEELGRRLLFRENDSESEPLESMEAQARSFDAAAATVREAMQRLQSTGLVAADRGRHGLASPPLDQVRGFEALTLELRCAATPDQRRRAFESWLKCLHFAAANAFRAAIGREGDQVRLLHDELERITSLGYTSYDPAELALESMGVIWRAGKASELEPLLLMVNSLGRGFRAIEPWLAAVIQNRQLAEHWTRVAGALLLEDRNKVDDAVAALFSKLIKRMRKAAEHEQPEPMEQGHETQFS